MTPVKSRHLDMTSSKMAHFRMPYQCMEKCGNLLVAARGSSIDLFSLEDGSLKSTWNCPTPQGGQNGPQAEQVTIKLATQNPESSVDITIDSSFPPAKKRKLSASETDKTKNLTSKEGKKKQNNRSDAVASGLEAPAVINLAIANGGQHVIAVTGEDKSIRVFEVVLENGGNPQLRQLSQR